MILEETAIFLKRFGRKFINPLAIAHLRVEYQEQVLDLPIVVVPGHSPLLIDRNWLKVVKFDWKIFSPPIG